MTTLTLSKSWFVNAIGKEEDFDFTVGGNMIRVIIMRGLPGSGKSTLAKQIYHEYRRKAYECCILSTDDFWGPDYAFDVSMLSQAHGWNQDRCRAALNARYHCVIIDNTNTTYKEMKPYLKHAKDFGYDVSVVQPETSWAFDVDECFKRNSHGVPLATLHKMKDRFEDLDDIRTKVRRYLNA